MTAFTLKIIASICMLIDHIGAVFPASTPEFFRFIGRISFPIYAYLIAQGCKHTKNLGKYMLRLGVFALISEIPFDIAFWSYRSGGALEFDINFFRHTNVFYTLFLGAACIVVYEGLKRKKKQWLALIPVALIPATILLNFLPEQAPVLTIAAICFGLLAAAQLAIAAFAENAVSVGEAPLHAQIIPFIAVLPLLSCGTMFRTDYDFAGVALIFLLYLVKPENKLARTIALVAGAVYFYGPNVFGEYGNFVDGAYVVTSNFINYNALACLAFALAAVVLVFFYNGKRGAKVKWAFYAFYPVHIAALAVLWLFLE